MGRTMPSKARQIPGMTWLLMNLKKSATRVGGEEVFKGGVGEGGVEGDELNVEGCRCGGAVGESGDVEGELVGDYYRS
ncbi:hypothetical protein HS088_TW05G00495 [Tripterygium wilfordii]|uniref:Uncharacterized protein n=1 Tax=Tripterygium wilfordii TaxID=458696 RepID=A0A7J7DN52_TRIWF|nr:hypothetical protein HS088_TW05G00495 [Tripterygium wilfordii]